MMRTGRWKTIESVAIAGLVCAAGAWTQARGQEAAVVVELAPGTAGVSEVQPGQFAIGVHCRPVDPALRKQLRLKENEGVVVELVVKESPAAKAGLEQFDILLSAQGERLDSIADLMRVVGDSEGRELKIGLLRAGKKETVIVTPVARGEVDLPNADAIGSRWQDRLPEGREFDEVRKWMDRFQVDPQQPFRLRGVGPGIVIDGRDGEKLPANVSISITKSGAEPAKIHVERKTDDGKETETWDVTEETIDELPEDLRPQVQRLVGKPGAVRFDLRRMQPPIVAPRAGDDDRRVERRLEEVEKRMERMMEELRNRRGESDDAPRKSRRPQREQSQESAKEPKSDV